jgi:hypothetical protein
MDKYMNIFEEDPGLEGPDYVALVIDWDHTADELEAEQVDDEEPTTEYRRRRRWPTVLGIAGALGLVAAAGWGFRRWRAA